jgi:hypothetical protein
MIIFRVSQGVTRTIAIPMYKVGTLNVISLATMRWKLVTISYVLCQTPQARNSLTNKGLRGL